MKESHEASFRHSLMETLASSQGPGRYLYGVNQLFQFIHANSIHSVIHVAYSPADQVVSGLLLR